MKVPFVDLNPQHQQIKTRILKDWEEILDTTAFVGGKWVADFERGFAKLCDTHECAAVDSGTDALEVALRAFKVKPHDEIIVPANTFYATIEAILLVGAKPVLVDCEYGTWNIDTTAIEKAISKKTVGIIGVHLYGNPCDMNAICAIAKKNRLWVLEDSAQAHLATYQGKKCGSLGDAAAFSFYPGKNLGSTGEGGAITTNQNSFIKTVHQIRNHGCKEKYVHEILGKNSKMPTVIAAALSIKLDYIEEWTEMRRKNAALYIERLKDIEGIVLPTTKEGNNPVWHLFVIHVEDRDTMHSFLKVHGIGTGFHYPVPVHLQKYFSKKHKLGDFPVAEYNATHGLSLPMYAELTEEQIDYVCGYVKECLTR